MACEQRLDTVIRIPNSTLTDYQTNATGTGVNILIEAINGHTGALTATFSQQANQHPSPYSRSHTSTVRTANDRVEISGWVRCIACTGPNAGNIVDFTGYPARFKRLMEVQQYTQRELALINGPLGAFSNMRLAEASFSLDGERPQEMQIFSQWEAMNVAGDMRSPAWASGGLET